MHKIMLIKHDWSGCDSYSDGYEPDIIVQDLCLTELLKSQDWEIKNSIHQLVMKALESDDENLRYMLKSKGWVNVQEIEDREKKLEASKEYWIYHDDGPLRVLDVNNLSVGQVRQLADPKSHVLQAISKDSVKKLMDKKKLKEYNRESIRFKKLKQARAEAAKKKSEAKRLKEIEKAKKILAEASE